MSRVTSSGARGFRCGYISYDTWRITWVMDFYYAWSPLRWPRGFSRITDLAGAKLFCKKHGLPAPVIVSDQTASYQEDDGTPN